jgi:hypothetical protein
MVNDSGAGQVQEWLVESTLFALVERPVLVITGGSATQESVSVTPGTKVVVASFDVKNTGNTDATFFSIVLAAQKGDVRNCESYTLWQVNSDGTRTFAAGGCVSNFAPDYNSQYVVHLGGIFTVPVGKTVHYEVTAVASQTPYYPKMLQVYLNPRWVDVNDSDWNTLGVDKVFYWFGEHPLFTISNDLG